jgi:hypothetical protein
LGSQQGEIGQTIFLWKLMLNISNIIICPNRYVGYFCNLQVTAQSNDPLGENSPSLLTLSLTTPPPPPKKSKKNRTWDSRAESRRLVRDTRFMLDAARNVGPGAVSLHARMHWRDRLDETRFSGANVIIAFVCGFCRKKLRFFLKTFFSFFSALIHTCNLSRNCQFFSMFYGENIVKIIISVPLLNQDIF